MGRKTAAAFGAMALSLAIVAQPASAAVIREISVKEAAPAVVTERARLSESLQVAPGDLLVFGPRRRRGSESTGEPTGAPDIDRPVTYVQLNWTAAFPQADVAAIAARAVANVLDAFTLLAAPPPGTAVGTPGGLASLLGPRDFKVVRQPTEEEARLARRKCPPTFPNCGEPR